MEQNLNLRRKKKGLSKAAQCEQLGQRILGAGGFKGLLPLAHLEVPGSSPVLASESDRIRLKLFERVGAMAGGCFGGKITNACGRKPAEGREWMGLLPFVVLSTMHQFRPVCSLVLRRSSFCDQGAAQPLSVNLFL